MNFRCPVCGAKGKSKQFVSKQGTKYMGRGLCINGHEFLVRLKLKGSNKSRFRVIWLLYNMDEENKELYERRKREAKESRIENTQTESC